jgi:phage replication O-like protein O
VAGLEDVIGDLLRGAQDSAQPGRVLPFSEANPSENADRDTKKFTKVSNEVLEKLVSFGFTRRELLIVLVVIRKTCGWHKNLDRLSYSQVSEATRIDRRNVRRTMLRLRDANVLLCGGYRPNGEPYEWGLDKRIELWNCEMLRRSRKREGRWKSKFAKTDGVTERAKSAPKERGKLTPMVGAKSPPRGEGQNDPPQKKELKKEKERRKKYGAAFAAPPLSSFSSSSKPEGEKQGGSIGSPKDPPSVERPSPAIETQMAPHDQVRIVQLCGELEAGGVNSYPWVGGKRRKGALAAHIIRVLEKAVVQRPGAADFDVFAERVFGEICSSG